MKRILAVVLAALLFWAPVIEAQGSRTLLRKTIVNRYSTTFPGTANPILERGAWVCAKTTGIDWNDIRTTPTFAYGTQSGSSGTFDDGVCAIQGTWGATQVVSAIVSVTNPNATAFEELELWSRLSITPHSVKGYEANFRATRDGSQYIGIVKWLGPFGGAGVQYTQLGSNCTLGTDGVPGLFTGDVISLEVSGTSTVTLVAKVNGTTRCTQTDSSSPYTTGNPGMGHWYRINGATGTAATDYGLTSFTATGS